MIIVVIQNKLIKNYKSLDGKSYTAKVETGDRGSLVVQQVTNGDPGIESMSYDESGTQLSLKVTQQDSAGPWQDSTGLSRSRQTMLDTAIISSILNYF